MFDRRHGTEKWCEIPASIQCLLTLNRAECAQQGDCSTAFGNYLSGWLKPCLVWRWCASLIARIVRSSLFRFTASVISCVSWMAIELNGWLCGYETIWCLHFALART